VLILAASVSLAQMNTGSLSGTITDANGAIVPAAKVTARNIAAGQDYQTLSTEAGLYVFASLPVGAYSVTFEKTGFKKLNRGNIEIRVAQRQTLDVALEVGDVQQTVEVTAEAPLLEATTSERGQSFSNKFMDTLPLFTGGIRNPRAFTGYMPGVNDAAERSVNGSGGRAEEVMIDGASLIIPESGGTVFYMPSAEMFGEFKLLTSNYSAEYGRFGGGVELFITKSGTNQLHGRGFWNLRRDIFDANAWDFNRRGIARPKVRINESGFGLGGPVWIPKVYNGKNRTFWFVTYSRDLRPANFAAVQSTVPTAANKQGDFGSINIYDPLTTVGQVRQPFPNNRIPAARISRISQGFLALLPDPNGSSLQNNLAFVNTSKLTDYWFSVKVDHAFSPNNRLAFFHTFQRQNTGSVQFLPGPLGQGLGESFVRPKYPRFNHDLVIRPNILLHSTFGYSQTKTGWNNPDQAGFASKVGLNLPTNATPRIRFNAQDGYTAFGVQDGKVDNGFQDNNTYMFTSALTWLRGKHEFKMGGDIRRLQTVANDKAGSNGLFQFERFQTALPTQTANTGNSFASFLLGAPDRVEFTTLPVPDVQIRYGYHAGFFQDNWKVRPGLTLNLGFRYEVPIGWHMANFQYSSFSPTATNPRAGNRAGAMIFMGPGPGRTGTKRPYNTDFSNFGPRAGFAWQLGPNTVIRGGFGIYYQTLGNGGCGCTLGFAGPPGIIDANRPAPALFWDTGLVIPQGAVPPFIDPSFGNFLDVDYTGPDFGKAPRIYNWSFNIQHTVKNFLIDVAYVGNRGHGLNSTLDYNQVEPRYLQQYGSNLGRLINDPVVAGLGISPPFAGFGNRTLAQALRPYPQFLNVLDRNSGDGLSWYDALQTKVERRFGGWQMMGAYTFSKSLGRLHFRQIFSQLFSPGGQAQDNYNLADQKSYLPFDQPHVFTLLSSYDIPVGKGRKFLADKHKAVDLVVGGWNVGVAMKYWVPAPVYITSTNSLAGLLFTRARKAVQTNVPIRANGARDQLDPSNPSVRWFTPCQTAGAACINGTAPFANPASDTAFGTAAWFHSDLRNPKVFSENLALTKRFNVINVGDNAINLRAMANFFNVFNRTRFGVNGTFASPDFGRATGPQVGARLITLGVMAEF